MAHALRAAQTALAATPTQLQVLARSRVVDAGGQGFVYFLEGMLDPLKEHRAGDAILLESLTFPAAYEELAGAAGGHRRRFRGRRTWGYGRGARCGGDRRALPLLRRSPPSGRGARPGGHRSGAVGHLGESLVLAGGATHMRVHLHTNEPEVFRGALEALATVESFKIDDMVAQQTAAKAATIALVTDSTVDLPEAAQLRSGMVMVPLTVSLGGKTYLDRVELGSSAFYRLLRETGELPRTSQPNRADFRRVYESSAGRLRERRIRSTCRRGCPAPSSRRGPPPGTSTRAGCGSSTRVTCRWGSGSWWRRRGRPSRRGASLDEVVAVAEDAARNTRVYGATPSLDFAVRGGRVSAKVARLAGLIELNPIILFDEEGAAHTDGAHLGFNRALRGLARRAVDFARRRRRPFRHRPRRLALSGRVRAAADAQAAGSGPGHPHDGVRGGPCHPHRPGRDRRGGAQGGACLSIPGRYMVFFVTGRLRGGWRESIGRAKRPVARLRWSPAPALLSFSTTERRD